MNFDVPPLPDTPDVRNAVEEIAAAVAADVAECYQRFLEESDGAVIAFALCTVDDAVPPYAMGAVQDDLSIPAGVSGSDESVDIHPPDWSWNDSGGSFSAGEIIDRILNPEEASGDDLEEWQRRSNVCLRGMVEGLKRFEAGGGFTSSVPRDQRLLLLWVNDSSNREWMQEWSRELNPPAVAEWFARSL